MMQTMKSSYSLLSWCLVVALALAACTKDYSLPSPLEGVVVEDVTMEADQTEQVIELNNKVLGISARAIDEATGAVATWLSASVRDTKLTLKAQENPSIRDRVATVTLYSTNQGQEMQDGGGTLSFRVTQKMNRQFEGLDIQEVMMGSSMGDTIIALGRSMKNVVVEVESPNRESVSWCTARLRNDHAILVHVQEYLSAGERSALIRLKAKNSTADSLSASVAFLVRQEHNRVFDGLIVTPAHLNHEGTKQVIHTGRQLKGVKAAIQYDADSKDGNWCSVSVAGDSITVGASKLTVISDRSVEVMLYLPNNGTTIDSTTLKMPFLVVQHHNDVFDGLQIPTATLQYDQARLSFKVNRSLKGVKAQVLIPMSQNTANWLKVTAEGDSVVLKPTVHRNNNDRVAEVTLFYSDKSTPDSTAAQTTFTVKQMHNPVFDQVNLFPANLNFDETHYRRHIGRQLKDIKTKVECTTESDGNWLTAKAAGDSLVLGSSVHKNAGMRGALVTLYYPNGGSVPNDSMVCTNMLVTQLSNPVFEGITLEDMTVDWAQNEYHQYFYNNPSGIKWLLTDQTTGNSISWLSASLSGKTLTLKTKDNTGLYERRAKVLLYYPNGTDAKRATVRDSFMLKQWPKPQLTLTPKKLTIGYEHKVSNEEVYVWSNVDVSDVNSTASWLKPYVPDNHGNEFVMKMYPSENTTEAARQANVVVRVMDDRGPTFLTDTVVVTQKTNPKITLFGGDVSRMSFRKGESNFDLEVHTLTPGYKVVKKASWITVGGATRAREGLYYNKISLKRFTGTGFERKDTLIVKNDEVACSLLIVQDKYIYLDDAEKEVEVGEQFKLNHHNGTTNGVTWSSKNDKVATVDQSGLVTGVGRGSTTIHASIGPYSGLPDYSDYCTVKVYDASDKVDVRHGFGNYVKDDGLVTSDCPIIITNNYHSDILVESLYVIGDNGATRIGTSDYQWRLSAGEQSTRSLKSSLKNVYEPKIVLVFSVNGKQYSKTVAY